MASSLVAIFLFKNLLLISYHYINYIYNNMYIIFIKTIVMRIIIVIYWSLGIAIDVYKRWPH